MFNDRYGLTEAVLEGRKTMTRRIEKGLENLENGIFCLHGKGEIHLYGEGGTIVEKIKTQYQLGEIVAISQSYKHIYCVEPHRRLTKEYSSWFLKQEGLTNMKGWKNKMFVKAEYMPHHIRIVGIKLERLQDISDEDCLKEGIDYCNGYSDSYYLGHGIKVKNKWIKLGNSSREAFAALIDKVSGKGTWERNPWVFVYEFELID